MSFCPKCGSKKDSSNKCPKCDVQKDFYHNQDVAKSFCPKCGNPSEKCTCNLRNSDSLSLKKKTNISDNKGSLSNNNFNNYANDQNTLDNINLENTFPEKNIKNTPNKKKKGKISLIIILLLIFIASLSCLVYFVIIPKIKDNNLKKQNTINEIPQNKQDIIISSEPINAKDENIKNDLKVRNSNELIKRIETRLNSEFAYAIPYISISFKDYKSTDLFSLNNKSSNSASVIKLYIMIEAYNQIKSNKISENQIVVLENYMKASGSGVLVEKPSGTSFTISELIEIMIIESDNTAANILIDMLGINNINSTISKLNLKNTSLSRKMMDQNAIDAGIVNYCSANDLVKTFDLITNGKCIDEYYDLKMVDVLKKQKNRSKLPKKLPSKIEVANKTGELPNIENDAGIIYTPNGNYSIAILVDGSIENKRELISDISLMIYDEYINFNFE